MTGSETDTGSLLRQSFRLTLGQFGAAVVLLTGLGIAGVAYMNARSTVEDLSGRIFEAHADFVEAQAEDFAHSANNSLQRNAQLLRRGLVDTELRSMAPHLVDTLRANPRLSTATWGTPDGAATWAERNLKDELRVHIYEGQAAGNPMHRVYRVQEDDTLALEHEEPTTYVGTKRPWYRTGAKAKVAPRWTDPYLFVPDNVPGLTLARAVDHDGALLGVLTVDFRLDFLSKLLAGLDDDDQTQGVLYDDAGHVLAHSDVTRTRVEKDGAMQVATLDGHPDPLLRALTQLPPHDEGSRFIEIDGERFAVTTHRPPVGAGGLTWRTAIFTPERELLKGVRQNAMWSVLIAAVGLVWAMLASILISRRLTHSFYGFYDEMERLGQLDLEIRPREPTRILEMERLASRLDDLKRGLRSFARYVPIDLVRELIAEGREAMLGGETRELSVLFTDIAGFTPIVESEPVERLVEALGVYLETIDAEIRRTGGNVTAYLGDGVFAIWGAPTSHEDHAIRACRAALAMRDAARRLVAEAETTGAPAFHTRIGINSGPVVVGNIGSPQRFNYTAIGDVVNTGSRIEGLNKVYGAGVLIGQRTRELIGDAFVVRRIDRVCMKGKSVPVWVYELVGAPEAMSHSLSNRIDAYESALERYLARDFAGALEGFEALSGDPASAAMAESCRHFIAQPPPPDWDGVRVMQVK